MTKLTKQEAAAWAALPISRGCNPISDAVKRAILADVSTPLRLTASGRIVLANRPQPLPPKGARVRLVQDVDRFPDFIAPAGMVGTVVESSKGMFAVRLDEPLTGAEEWNNEVCWNLPGEPPHADIEVIA